MDMAMENQKPIEGEGKGRRSVGSSIIVAVVGAFSLLYLINPTFGVFELIPDNIAGFGNIDEAGAAMLLISCLSYFGLISGDCSVASRKNRKASSTSKSRTADYQPELTVSPRAFAAAAAMILGM